MEQHYYMLVNLAAFLPVFILSFDEKVAFWSKRSSIFKAIAIVATPFIAWDMWFTNMGVWGFNQVYLGGLNIYNLPLEEVLFFVAIPYASIFTYQCVRSYFKTSWIQKLGRPFLILVSVLCILAIATQGKNWYTGLTAALLLPSCLFLVWKNPEWLGHFSLGYLLIIPPFIILNGILTGTGIPEQIVWYNEEEMIGQRLLTIPVEDFFYGMLLILWNVYFYQTFIMIPPKEKPDYKRQSYKTHG